MVRLVRSAVDSLDIAFQGHLTKASVQALEAAREAAALRRKDVASSIGAAGFVVVRPTGTRSGYRYVVLDGLDGAIYCFRANDDANGWNGFVSVRALCLLRRGYAETKAYVLRQLAALGFQVEGYSVNRIDYAFDLVPLAFKLDIANVVCPSRSTVRPYWSEQREMTDTGEMISAEDDHLSAVIRGQEFESVTIGKLPARQVTLYNKTKAAQALRQDYWFDAFGVDPATQVWRGEIRAGREALEKLTMKRSFEAVEAALPTFLQQATRQVRLAVDAASANNIGRADIDPLWRAIQAHATDVNFGATAPKLTDAAIVRMREDRVRAAQSNAFGNLINCLALEGFSPEEIARRLPVLASEEAFRYLDRVGEEAAIRKVQEVSDRLAVLIPQPELG